MTQAQHDNKIPFFFPFLFFLEMLTTKDIWSNNLNRTEERKLIHQFWLELSEDERKSLILIEKEAVINKIKDQQKNTCNCSICGKTR